MEVFESPDTIRTWVRRQRCQGRTIAVVPTMGALHDGHLALIDEAGVHADVVIVTIFVNPLQFNQSADFERYPRPIDTDLDACRDAGVDAVYMPAVPTMYPGGFETHVVPGRLADRLEGPMRPGHFVGVATVVTKLFTATEPDVAVFGQKDFQQLAIVRRMVADLDLAIDVVGLDTMREPDGLARSSRNTRLSVEDRAAATAIPRALAAAAEQHASGVDRVRDLETVARAVIDDEPRARLEYLEIVDAGSLEPIEVVAAPSVILVAVWFGDVRLIDNRVLSPT